jgi:hypothetical protein
VGVQATVSHRPRHQRPRTTTATGELPDGGWLIAMITGLTAVLLIGAGIALGIAHVAARPHRSTTT